MGQVLIRDSGFHRSIVTDYGQEESFVTLRVGEQRFGISVYRVEDVIRQHAVTPAPLANAIIKGSMNLRGRTVTVVDMRKRLGLPPIEDSSRQMNIVVRYKSELISLLVDEVGDVMPISLAKIEKNPANLNENWRTVATGVYRLKDELLVVLDIDGLLDF